MVVPVRLKDAGRHPLAHFRGGVANIDLAASDIRLAAVSEWHSVRQAIACLMTV